MDLDPALTTAAPSPALPSLSPPAPAVDLQDPAFYINRELSLLDFNERVLGQALDARIPLLERLRFLTIFSSNLDEFFEVRAAGLRESLGEGERRADGLDVRETLARISEKAHTLVEKHYATLNDVILPALEREGIRLVKRSAWSEVQRAWIERTFVESALPVLTPVGLDPAHPFPNVQNKSLNFIVLLEGEDAFHRTSGIAIVQVPRCLPRILPLPEDHCEGTRDFVMISSIIHAHVDQLFPGMEVLSCHQFRVTRNSDLSVDEDEADDLLTALQGELPRRNYGQAVRLEVADDCPEHLSDFLLHHFELDRADLYRVNGPVNLHRLAALTEQVDRPDLKYPAFAPGVPRVVLEEDDLFAVLRERDVLLHHPFQSFAPVIDLLRQAAEDPDVLAIKITLYRTGADSPLVDALIGAAGRGKAVTAVVELRARFDEADNIRLATRLQEAGANVAYGIVDYKCHAKTTLIVRREGDRLRRYVHLGTGNYHLRNTRAYTDLSLMTADPAIGSDVHAFFLQLTGLGKPAKLSRLLQSPFTLHSDLLRHIEHEASEARAGRPSRIIAKINGLTEPAVIQALYRASQAGVPIDLVVRGICCLRPGLPGVSENIRVRGIVGRFLEHARVYHFHAAGRRVTWCSSADWRGRNLLRRVELGFPIQDRELNERLVSEALLGYLEDNTEAWELSSDGTWRRRAPLPGEEPFCAQMALLRKYSD